MESTTCPHCCKNYNNTSARNKHIRKIHPTEVQILNKASHIYCPLCTDKEKQGMASCIALVKHFRDQHNVVMEEENLTFLSLEDFENWMKLEYRNVDYIKDRTWKESCKTVKNYNCNRSNTVAFKSNCTKYLMKKGGSIKINGVCPSRITAQFYIEGKVEVRFIKTHVGHENELRTRRLTPEEQNEIVKNVMCKHVHMVSLYERSVLAESVLDEEAENEESENFCTKETSEEKLKLREAANEFLEERCQDLDNKDNVEENVMDVETYKDIFFKNLAYTIKLDLSDFKKLAAQWTLDVKEFQGNTFTKRKMEKQTYYPQPQKKQRKE